MLRAASVLSCHLLVVAALVASAPPARASGSILERVLRLIEAQDFAGVFINSAIAMEGLHDTALTLRPGQEVVVGFDALGNPVTATAGATGLVVDDAAAGGIVSGLARGLYPVGSALYSLPPAGQLSLWQQDAQGSALREARGLIAGRVDGRIGIAALADDLQFAQLGATAVTDRAVTAATGRVFASTVLGVSNAGTVLSGLTSEALVPDLSSVTMGARGRIDQAIAAGGVEALAQSSRLISGGDGPSLVALNLGSNAQDVTGAVRLQVERVAVRVGAITPTVLGAVNDGLIVAVAP